MSKICKIEERKKTFLPLLLLADEQEDMIDRYLERGELFVLYEDDVPLGVCVVTDEGEGLLEIKNVAVLPVYQRKGYGKRLLHFVERYYAGRCRLLQVGTGATPHTLLFYANCGYRYSHRIPDFFTQNYDHPIVEEGIVLKDMIYLRKEIE